MYQAEMMTIFEECRQCGSCCKAYRKVLLQPDEVDFIRKMGGHVGVDVRLDALRDKGLAQLEQEVAAAGKVYMVHPDDRGCVFLQKRNDKYVCRIYHHRPRSCRGFRCTLADASFHDIFAADAIHLLGMNRFGLPLEKK
ncbi:MAG: hypothetical protein BWK76_12570 [Desulfobulbaceae bacterium A2]|nr:MAG: hypothetical protein BWK76_12570 [Desulfobulbaceae bacterium A2]